MIIGTEQKRYVVKYCPICGTETRSRDSRPTKEGIRRRRECPSCGNRFTTYEVTEEEYLRLRGAKKILTRTKNLLKATLGTLNDMTEEAERE